MEKDESMKQSLKKNLDLAIQSVASYVERSDTLVILVPPSVHNDHVNSKTGRKMYTCYRTWRRRGLCLLEFFACLLSRRKTHPALLVRSAMQTPMWISPHECLKLSVGEADFTCCETNHRGHDGVSLMECCRPAAYSVLSRLVAAKVHNLHVCGAVVHARWNTVFEHFWTRGLVEKEKSTRCLTSAEFRKLLKWEESVDGEWIDREGVTLLTYV